MARKAFLQQRSPEEAQPWETPGTSLSPLNPWRSEPEVCHVPTPSEMSKEDLGFSRSALPWGRCSRSSGKAQSSGWCTRKHMANSQGSSALRRNAAGLSAGCPRGDSGGDVPWSWARTSGLGPKGHLLHSSVAKIHPGCSGGRSFSSQTSPAEITRGSFGVPIV